jgi:protein-tyrosine phosphatase
MLRSVALPPSVRGALYLHSMPGWHEPYNRVKQEILGLKITRVVCLAPKEEVRGKSPNYAQAIEAGNTSWAQDVFPIADHGVPQDRHAFMDLSQTIAQALRSGERVLVHCGAGIGRTGTLAVGVLMALGVAQHDAGRDVADAGSGPETRSQEELVQWIADQLGLS